MDKLMISANDREIRMLRVSDIQQYVGLGRERAYALMRSAGVPSTRIGRTYFVTADNFEKWLNDYKYKTFILQE